MHDHVTGATGFVHDLSADPVAKRQTRGIHF